MFAWHYHTEKTTYSILNRSTRLHIFLDIKIDLKLEINLHSGRSQFFTIFSTLNFVLLPLSLKTRSVTEWRGENHSIIYANNDIEFLLSALFSRLLSYQVVFAVCACLHRQLLLFRGEITNVVTKVDKISIAKYLNFFLFNVVTSIYSSQLVSCVISMFSELLLIDFCWSNRVCRKILILCASVTNVN